MKPLCCVPLRSGVKFIAFIDLIVAAVLLVASIVGFIYYEINYLDAVNFLNNPPEQLDLFINLRNVDATTIRILLSFCVFYYFKKLALGFVLFFAASRESKFMLRFHVFYTLALLVLHILVYLAMLCLAMMEPWSIPVYVGGFLIREYFMWITTSYLHRLTYGLTEDDELNSCDDDDHYSYKL